MSNLEDVQEGCPTCTNYIKSMNPRYRGMYNRTRERYQLDTEAVEKLKEYADAYTLVVLFADWCGDARKAVPVLSLLEDEIGLEIKALGGMEKPKRRSDKHWAVPPSPEEVEILDITSSPTIIIFDERGEEVDRIRTRPRITPTIEEEILTIIERDRGLNK
ncbi:MAG: thioredoxin family protein [Candidatus Thorarchaeota archaeon]